MSLDTNFVNYFLSTGATAAQFEGLSTLERLEWRKLYQASLSAAPAGKYPFTIAIPVGIHMPYLLLSLSHIL